MSNWLHLPNSLSNVKSCYSSELKNILYFPEKSLSAMCEGTRQNRNWLCKMCERELQGLVTCGSFAGKAEPWNSVLSQTHCCVSEAEWQERVKIRVCGLLAHSPLRHSHAARTYRELSREPTLRCHTHIEVKGKCYSFCLLVCSMLCSRVFILAFVDLKIGIFHQSPSTQCKNCKNS